MNIKNEVDKIYKKVWDDHHITPEDFQRNLETHKANYEDVCKDFTDEEKEQIKRSCELWDSIFAAETEDEVMALRAELDKELETIKEEEWKIYRRLTTAIEYFRAGALAEKYKDKPCYTTKKIRASYRKPKDQIKKRWY